MEKYWEWNYNKIVFKKVHSENKYHLEYRFKMFSVSGLQKRSFMQRASYNRVVGWGQQGLLCGA